MLDEADEMLDLGFREDLETLLEAAPDDAPHAAALGDAAAGDPRARARYQRDALAIDPRKARRRRGPRPARARTTTSPTSPT